MKPDPYIDGFRSGQINMKRDLHHYLVDSGRKTYTLDELVEWVKRPLFPGIFPDPDVERMRLITDRGYLYHLRNAELAGQDRERIRIQQLVYSRICPENQWERECDHVPCHAYRDLFDSIADPDLTQTVCRRCGTPATFDEVSDGYYAYCPKHDEDLYPFETAIVMIEEQALRGPRDDA